MLLDNLEDDFKWYNEDPEGYMAESDKRDAIASKKFREFMGPEFANEPLFTAGEIQEKIENQMSRLERLRVLKAPALLIDNEERMLSEHLDAYKKGEYAVTESEIKYKEAYMDKLHEWLSIEHPLDFNSNK